MLPNDAYDAICAAIEADPRKRIIDRRYDERHFGSFALSFEDGREARCIINDRGVVFATERLDGTGEATVMVPSLRDEDAKSLL